MRRARPLLGTIVDITAEGGSLVSTAIEAAFASIEEVHRLMSFHDAESDVSRINNARPGEEIAIDPHTCRVLSFAHQISEMSGGLFDVTTAPVLVANGFLPRPRKQTISSAANYRDLLLVPDGCVQWRRKGWIDLGGIAKGYAVDCAVAALCSRGVNNAVVNAGGDLRCFGAPQPIHVRHPEEPTTLLCLGSLEEGAIATSAGYFSRLDAGGQHMEPLIDPRNGTCTSWKGSISVVARDAMTADALTKAVALTPDAAPDMLAHFAAQAILIDGDGMRCCGEGLLRADIAAWQRAQRRRTRRYNDACINPFV
jgi:thiamine biosynthesis lipoprotein